MVKKIDVDEAKRVLESAGFKVLDNPYEKKTFEVRGSVLKQFLEVVKKSNSKIKDAITEALELWIKQNK